MYAGTPDQVFAQIVDFYEHVGGFGNLLMMCHAGTPQAKPIADLAIAHRLPTMNIFRLYPTAGGLMSFSRPRLN